MGPVYNRSSQQTCWDYLQTNPNVSGINMIFKVYELDFNGLNMTRQRRAFPLQTSLENFPLVSIVTEGR